MPGPRRFWFPFLVTLDILVPVGLVQWYLETLPRSCQRLQEAASFAGTTARFDDFVSAGRHPGGTCTAAPIGSVRAGLLLGIPKTHASPTTAPGISS
jgi:hypothetical protein